MSISFQSTQKLLRQMDEMLEWYEKQEKRSKKVNNLKKKIYENCKK